MEQDLALARQCADTVVGAIYDGTAGHVPEHAAFFEGNRKRNTGDPVVCAEDQPGCCCGAMQRIVQYDKLPESIFVDT